MKTRNTPAKVGASTTSALSANADPTDTVNGDAGVAGIKLRRSGLSSRLALKVMLFTLIVQGASLRIAWHFYADMLSQWADYRIFVIFAASASLCAGLGAFIAGRSIASRVSRVAELLERTQSGDYKQRLKLGLDDEIGLLSRRANLLCSTAEVREKRIIESALTDALTGLPNRGLLTNRLEHALRTAERNESNFSVALIDLDRFKSVNDTLGHDAGDMLLIEVSRRLKATVRNSDTVARLGGDEFVLLMMGGRYEAQQVSKHVLDSMMVPMQLQGSPVDIGMSIGIAVYPDNGRDVLALMRHADAAMYSAKRKRKNQAAIFEGDASNNDLPNAETLSMVSEMRIALEQKQFELYYQPKLDLSSGLIKGVEGLIRWNHPTRGLVNPNDFIPIAEESGFMRDLTAWVIEEGAGFAAEMERSDLDVRVSVNISARDVEDAEFSTSVQAILEKEKLESRHLCLEITETSLVSDSAIAMDNLKALAEFGVWLSVDDFGTGYSSLQQIQQLPVHELKIDRSFVSGMIQNRGNSTIVNSTIEMGRDLGLNVVAEGVENVTELRTLAAMGCDEVQGFYLSRPLPKADVLTWIDMRHSLYDSSRDAYFKMLITG